MTVSLVAPGEIGVFYIATDRDQLAAERHRVQPHNMGTRGGRGPSCRRAVGFMGGTFRNDLHGRVVPLTGLAALPGCVLQRQREDPDHVYGLIGVRVPAATVAKVCLVCFRPDCWQRSWSVRPFMIFRQPDW